MSYPRVKKFIGSILCTIGIHKYTVSESLSDMALLECERCELPKAIKVRG